MPDRARVVLVDDSSFVLQGLQVALSKSRRIRVVGTACTEADAFALMRMYEPDVVVLDVQVGQASGIDMCRVIRDSYPKTAVFFFTANDDKSILRSAILAGAQGYLLKGASGEAIVKSIEIVVAGQAIMDQRLTQQLLTWIRDGKQTVPHEPMEDCSKTDLRVLSLIAAGKSNKEIGQELNVKPNVVAARLRTVYRRLSISRRSEAVRCFMQWEQGGMWTTGRFH